MRAAVCAIIRSVSAASPVQHTFPPGSIPCSPHRRSLSASNFKSRSSCFAAFPCMRSSNCHDNEELLPVIRRTIDIIEDGVSLRRSSVVRVLLRAVCGLYLASPHLHSWECVSSPCMAASHLAFVFCFVNARGRFDSKTASPNRICVAMWDVSSFHQSVLMALLSSSCREHDLELLLLPSFHVRAAANASTCRRILLAIILGKLPVA